MVDKARPAIKDITGTNAIQNLKYNPAAKSEINSEGGVALGTNVTLDGNLAAELEQFSRVVISNATAGNIFIQTYFNASPGTLDTGAGLAVPSISNGILISATEKIVIAMAQRNFIKFSAVGCNIIVCKEDIEAR